MNFIDVEQGSPEWHKLRRTKIGASNSPALLGISPYKSAVDVYNEMVFGEKAYITSAMQNGTDREAEAREYFNNIVHYKDGSNRYSPAVVISEEYDLMMASLDGINPKHTTILEIKVPGHTTYGLCVQDRVPIHWEYQIQHQLAVTGLDHAILFVYIDPTYNLIFRYTRDAKRISEIVSACVEFEEKYLSTFTCPPTKREAKMWDKILSTK